MRGIVFCVEAGQQESIHISNFKQQLKILILRKIYLNLKNKKNLQNNWNHR
jgi:hypothetical protein